MYKEGSEVEGFEVLSLCGLDFGSNVEITDLAECI